MITIKKSVPSLLGKLTSTIFDDYPIYKCYINCDLINNYLPDKLNAFDPISWKNLAKRDFFYSKPIIFASHSQLSDYFEELSNSIKLEDLIEELLFLNDDIFRYNFVITGDCLIFVRIPHKRHASYHILGKHITLSNRCEDVRFAGEFWRDQNKIYRFNNNSGTYRPSNNLLEKTVQLFNQLIPRLQFQGISFQISLRPSKKRRLIYKTKQKLTSFEQYFYF